MSKDSSKGYKFDILNGVVTAVYEVENGRSKLEGIDRDETWTFDGSQVLKTEYDDGRLETSVYADADGDGIYARISKTYAPAASGSLGAQPSPTATPSSKGYTFDLLDGVVTAVYEIERGVSHLENIDANETWTVQGTEIVKTEVEEGVIETTVYADGDGDGVYTKASKSYASSDGSSTQVWEGHHGDDADDRWTGSGGDDHYYGAAGNDLLNGGAGSDDLYGADGNDSLTGGAGADDIYGGNGSDSLSGGDGNDYLYSASGNDTVDAGLGDDLIVGGDGAGDDLYKGGSGVDTVKYTSALAGITVDLAKGTATSSFKPTKTSDTSGIGNDRLSDIENVIVGDYADLLTGSKLANKLEGGLGDDVLAGGLGKDLLLGGEGKDVFKFNSVSDSGTSAKTRDVIADFATGDTIDLSAIDAVAGNRSNDAFTFIGGAADLNAKNANGALWFEQGILYGSTDKDLAAEFQIELTGVTGVSVESFVL